MGKRTLPIKIIISLVILILLAGGVWYFWSQDFIKEKRTISTISEWESPGYGQEIKRAEKENIEISFKPLAEHEDEAIKRVVDNVTVNITSYPSQKEAQKQIEDASLVYIWAWRKEKILGQEVSTGYLFNSKERFYEAVYLAWVDGTTYYELIAKPADIRGYSEKEFMFKSAKEIATAILKER